MPQPHHIYSTRRFSFAAGLARRAGVFVVSAALLVQGCFEPPAVDADRDERVLEALNQHVSRPLPPNALTAADAARYALENNLDAKIADLDLAYQNEAAVAARRRLLPSLTVRYSMEHSNHPSARWSESTRTNSQSLESSYSADPNARHGDVGLMWNLLDFGVGYLRARQQDERFRNAVLQRTRVRQQVVLEAVSSYWRAAAAVEIAREAEKLRRELDEQAESIRDAVELRILSGAEGARRELSVYGGLSEVDQWKRTASQARLELARTMGSGAAFKFTLADFPEIEEDPTRLIRYEPSILQAAALKRRPELYQQDGEERIHLVDARLALLQMAPNASLSLSMYDDPDKFLEWNNWMTVGARVSWNLFNIPARMAEKRMAKLQGEMARQKGLALAAAVIAQVGIAYSDWKLAHEYAASLSRRAAARGRLVDALADGEKDGQTRPGEVLQERVRLLADRAAALRAAAEARVAEARLANAVGLEVDERGEFVWELGEVAWGVLLESGEE